MTTLLSCNNFQLTLSTADTPPSHDNTVYSGSNFLALSTVFSPSTSKIVPEVFCCNFHYFALCLIALLHILAYIHYLQNSLIATCFVSLPNCSNRLQATPAFFHLICLSDVQYSQVVLIYYSNKDILPESQIFSS